MPTGPSSRITWHLLEDIARTAYALKYPPARKVKQDVQVYAVAKPEPDLRILAEALLALIDELPRQELDELAGRARAKRDEPGKEAA